MSRYIIILLLFLIPISIFGSQDSMYLDRHRDRHPLLKEGITLFFAKDLEKAKAKFIEAEMLFQEQKEYQLLSISYLAQATCLSHARKWYKAIPLYKKAYEWAKKSKEIDTHKYAASALGFIFKTQGKYEEAIKYHHEYSTLLNLPEELPVFESNTRAIAHLFIKKADFDNAKYYLDESLKIATQLNDKDKLAKSDNAFSVYYLALNDFDKALQYRMKQLRYLESREKKDHILAITKLNVAEIFTYTEDWEKAKPYAESALEICNELGLRISKAHVLSTLGTIAEHTGDKQSVIPYYEQALELYRAVKQTPKIIRTLQNLATFQLNEGQFAQADTCLVEALYLAENAQDKSNELPRTLSKIGLLRLRQQKVNEAISVLKRAEKEALSFKDLFIYQEVNKNLAEAYQKIGQIQTAFQHLQTAYLVRDTLFTKEKEKIIHETEAKYQLAQKERSLAQLDLQNKTTTLELVESQKKQQIFGLGLIFLLGSLFLTFQLYHQKRKSNLKLERVNKMISTSLSEKEFLLKEIHHRVKNNLQIISSMLSLQSDRITDPKTLAIIKEGQNRVESMVLIHQHLYQNDNLSLIDCKEYIEHLARSLIQSYQTDTNKIQLITNIAPLPMKIDMVISLGLIINELISNALKYAFISQTKGILKIALQKDVQHISLKVCDNGIGLPEGFSYKDSDSLGFQLVHAFARKLRATIDIKSENGTEITLFIPNKTNQKSKHHEAYSSINS